MSDLIRVTVISRKGSAALVQYVEGGMVHRKYVPLGVIDNSAVDGETLEQGIPYGYPWDELSISFDSARFANELHNVDVWTTADALRSPQRVTAAIRATISDNLKEVLTIASSETGKGKK